MTELGAQRYALISKKLAETLDAELLNGAATATFTKDLKHFRQYMAALSSNA